MDNKSEIYKIIEPILGYYSKNVSIGVGSFITMFFMKNEVDIPKRNNDWFLWIYCCGWFLEKPNNPFLGCEDSREIIKKEIQVLENKKIINITISENTLETNFIFQDGLVLHTFPLVFHEECPSWMLFSPNGKVLEIDRTKWVYESSSKPLHNESSKE